MIAQERQQSIGHIEDKTSPMDVVTDIDRETQDLILKTLKKNFPEDITWGEESGYPLKDFSSTWVLDPIDGTTNYIHGLPLYSISLAYYHQGIPVIGVIDSPAFGKRFFRSGGVEPILTATPFNYLMLKTCAEAFSRLVFLTNKTVVISLFQYINIYYAVLKHYAPLVQLP